MSTKNLLDYKVEKEYEKMKLERDNATIALRNELHTRIPEIKFIDDKISTLAVTYASKIISQGISPEEAVKLVNDEKNELLTRRQAILDNANYTERKVNYNCEKCCDTGYVNGQKCECYIQMLNKLMKQNIDGSKDIVLNVDKSNFDNFSLKWYSNKVDPAFDISPFENMKSVYVECKQFCQNFGKENKNLYFYGSPGTGKTFMASCIANYLLKEGYTVVYHSAYKLFQFMEDFKFNRIDRDDNLEMFEKIYNCDLLIIDDIGTEFGTSYTCSVLFDILNTRILNEKSTIISSNLSINNLEKKYTERVSSRIMGYFEVIRFLGDDIRILKRKAGDNDVTGR